MTVIPIERPDDPRIAAFRDIRERDLTGREGLFIAEGAVVVRQLASPHALATPRALLLAANRVEAMGDVIASLEGRAPVYAADQAVLDAIAGFALHRGILGLGQRPPRHGLEAVAPPRDAPAVVLATSGIGNHDNMGGLFRNAAGFGADGVVLDARCCDPFYRKAIRVSAGAVLRTPTAYAGEAGAMVEALMGQGFEVIALTPTGGEPLSEMVPAARTAVLVGSEGPGLDRAVIERCRAISIPMAADFDSLNVATAAALALHHLAAKRGRSPDR
ncbi:MAG: RNA methyltransferase [Brevundimonas sp.]|nr:MAG: RNA methyltransferase [Brevundimonas sp.]